MIGLNEVKELVPENDLQELWQLSGRVQAAIAWLNELQPDDLVRVRDVIAILTK